MPGAAPVPAAYAGVDAAYDATERRGCCGSSGRYALEDVPEVLRVGQLYRGCLRAPALDPVAVDADGARRAMSETALEPGQQKRAKFPTSKAHISAVFHSFRLIFGRAIISRNGLEAWVLFLEHSR